MKKERKNERKAYTKKAYIQTERKNERNKQIKKELHTHIQN